MKNKDNPKLVGSHLKTVAEKILSKQVDDELKIPDPDRKKVLAILRNQYEDTKGNESK